jgi:hypothetical protein
LFVVLCLFIRFASDLKKTVNHNVYICHMWQFERFVPNKINIPEISIKMSRNGLENRYADRFKGYVGTSDDYLKKADQARSASDSLRTAQGVIEAQKENIDELFIASELMVKMIDNFQRESGLKQVKNVPLPGESITKSPGKKLGYVKLVMKFVSAGMLHFMETAIEMGDDIKKKEAVIKAIAEDQVEIPIIGRLTDIDLDDLSSDGPIVETKIPLQDESDASSVQKDDGSISSGSTPMTTPSKSPTPVEKKSKSPTPVTPSKTSKTPLKK